MWVYPEIKTLGDVPGYYSRHAPENCALISNGRQITYRELDLRSSKCANALLGRGLKTGGCVLFLGKNSDHFLTVVIGVAKAGARCAPLNWRLSARELEAIIADSEADFAFVDEAFRSVWEQIGADLNTVYLAAGSPDDSFEDYLAGASGDDPEIKVDESQCVLQMYTSGTTGIPKGVMISHSCLNHMRLCEHYEPAYDWISEDRLLFCAPNFHLLGAGLAIQALYNGCSVVIVPQFDPALVVEAISSGKPTLMAVAPTMLQMVLDDPAAESADFSSLRLVMYAGSAISLGLIKRALEKIPCRIMQFYGSTESVGTVTLLRPEEHKLEDEEKLKSCGKPLPLIEMRIVDTAGNEVADGQPGELVIRSPGIARGYWKKPEAWAEVYSDGWFKTGDIAYRDDEGFYYIYDRAKDMIVSGGENIYSAEVENALSTHPDVRAVAVIGIPSEKWGEEVKAFIIAASPISEAELISYARERLAGYKCPKSIKFLDSFPVTGSGKVSKAEMRAPYWEAKTRSVN